MSGERSGASTWSGERPGKRTWSNKRSRERAWSGERLLQQLTWHGDALTDPTMNGNPDLGNNNNDLLTTILEKYIAITSHALEPEVPTHSQSPDSLSDWWQRILTSPAERQQVETPRRAAQARERADDETHSMSEQSFDIFLSDMLQLKLKLAAAMLRVADVTSRSKDDDDGDGSYDDDVSPSDYNQLEAAVPSEQLDWLRLILYKILTTNAQSLHNR